MKIFSDLLTAEQIDLFKKYWAEHRDRAYVNYVDDRGQIVDHRCELDRSHDIWQHVLGVVRQHFKEYVEVWCAYQRQTTPHSLHIDDYGIDRFARDSGVYTYTYIIAPDTAPEFRSIIWKRESYCNEDMCREIVEEIPKMPVINDLSDHEDLDHVPVIERPISDYLELDGIFTYVQGHGCLFSAKQWHTSSYWPKHKQYDHRDLIQIHVVTEQLIDI